MTDILKQELTCDLVTVIDTIKNTLNFIHFTLPLENIFKQNGCLWDSKSVSSP